MTSALHNAPANDRLEENSSQPAQLTFAPPSEFIALEPKVAPYVPIVQSIPMAQFVAMPDEDVSRNGFLLMTIMLTRRCNMTCAHCSVESGPRVQGQPSEDELVQIVRDAARFGVGGVLLTGGEPMLREDVVMRLLAECRELGLGASLTTNAFWGKSPVTAAQKVKALCEAGVQRLTISYDRYHAEFQGPEPAVNIVRAADEMKLPMQITVNFTRAADDDLVALVAPFERQTKAQLRFYDVQPVGRARDIPSETLRAETKGFCNACSAPAVTDDGRLTACNGPAYFSSRESPLVVGSLREESLDVLLHRHRQDPILDTIRTFGPQYLRDELQKIPGFENFPFKSAYSGMCDLCQHLTSQPDATAVLHERMAQPREAAKRVAAQRVMSSARAGGDLNRDYVNTIAACRLFLRMGREPASSWSNDTERVLGRADFDWNHHALHLSQCGLGLPLQGALKEASFTRWAPPFFIERMNRQALHDTLCRLMQREAIGLIAQAIRAEETGGVLLKGAAMMALDFEEGALYAPRHPTPTRSCGDVDVLIPPQKAKLVRARLLQMGFSGNEQDSDVEDLHQLAGLSYRGMSIEIHQTLMPPMCGLPEREMLSHTRALQSEAWRGLRVLDAEGMLLHSLMHCSKHLFAHGLKAAWDVCWVLDRFEPDWERLARWVAKSGMRRGFWLPLLELSSELSLPVPEEFLRRAPRDRRGRKLATIARRHLFGKTHFPMQDNPWVCHALYILMCDSWMHRARCVYALAFGRYSRELRRDRQQQHPQHRRTRIQKLKKAWQSWRQLG
ncbi:MAG TPA: nucleotidyltransferase family protein [Abditibacteriaceae bacterium]|jgi:pyruvate-formate lyase-activating enzyme